MTEPALFDVLVVADSRFSGGSTSALASDVTAFSRLGMRVGLLFVRSAYLDDSRDPPNPAALALRDLDGVTTLRDSATARGALAFLHHPLVFARGIEERATLRADRSLLVTHHLPFRADGSLEYDPVSTLARARRMLGLRATFAPVSGLVRRQLRGFAPLIGLSDEDWPNTFNPAAWPVGPPILQGGRITIGRHGRADPLKWPATGAEIDACLPASSTRAVRVLGCPEAALRARGAGLEGWDLLAFGSVGAADFLASLDVFCCHVHPRLVEAFGRVVAEAMLCGRPCLLDPSLEANFGTMARYCAPMDVAQALDRLAADRADTVRMAETTRTAAIERFGQETIAARIARLRGSRTDRSRADATVGPLRTLRKVVGHHRRRESRA